MECEGEWNGGGECQCAFRILAIRNMPAFGGGECGELGRSLGGVPFLALESVLFPIFIHQKGEGEGRRMKVRRRQLPQGLQESRHLRIHAPRADVTFRRWPAKHLQPLEVERSGWKEPFHKLSCSQKSNEIIASFRGIKKIISSKAKLEDRNSSLESGIPSFEAAAKVEQQAHFFALKTGTTKEVYSFEEKSSSQEAMANFFSLPPSIEGVAVSRKCASNAIKRSVWRASTRQSWELLDLFFENGIFQIFFFSLSLLPKDVICIYAVKLNCLINRRRTSTPIKMEKGPSKRERLPLEAAKMSKKAFQPSKGPSLCGNMLTNSRIHKWALFPLQVSSVHADVWECQRRGKLAQTPDVSKKETPAAACETEQRK